MAASPVSDQPPTTGPTALVRQMSKRNGRCGSSLYVIHRDD
jgi:hypothetical protein